MEKKLKYINGTDVSHCKGFVFDGCHKIYVCENEEQYKDMQKFEYNILHPMETLEKTFDDTCPMRFISFADVKSDKMKRAIVPQCAPSVTFTYSDGTESVLKFTND